MSFFPNLLSQRTEKNYLFPAVSISSLLQSVRQNESDERNSMQRHISFCYQGNGSLVDMLPVSHSAFDSTLQTSDQLKWVSCHHTEKHTEHLLTYAK